MKSGFGHTKDELIIRSLQRLTSAREDQQLAEWRRAAPANERRYAEVAAIWAVMDGGYTLIASERPPAAAIKRQSEAGRALSLRSRRPLLRRRAAMAAAALIAGVSLSIVYLRDDVPVAPSLSFGVNEYHTGDGERATVRLADGSIVRLAPSSRLRFTGSQSAREVELEGHAFFAVAKDPRFPFIVRTRAGDAHVLGTRFDVRVTNSDLRVLVVDGRVEVNVQDTVVEVTSGQMSLATEGYAPAVVEVDVEPMLKWMGQSLVFQETPLGQVVKEIEQLYGAEIHIRDQDLLMRTITAWFVDEPFEEVMALVCRTVRVKCTIGPNSAEITTLIRAAVNVGGSQ